MRMTIWAKSAMLGTLGTAALLAQGSAPPPQTPQTPQRPATAPAMPQAQVFRTSTDAVTIDVVVKSAGGQFIPDLRMEEFLVLEDGVPQKIQTMSMSNGGRFLNLMSPTAVAAPEGVIMPTRRPVQDESGRVFVFFIDDANIEFLDTPRLRDLLHRIVKTLFHQGDLIAMVSSGPSSIEVEPNYDLKRINDEISKISGNAMTPRDIISAAQTSQGPAGLRYQANLAFRTALDMLQGLSAISDKRKAFVWVSSGYDFNPFQASRDQYQQELTGTSSSTDPSNPNSTSTSAANAAGTSTDPFLLQGQEFSEADLNLELSMLTAAANRANTTFYTFDPGGLASGMASLADSFADSSEWRTYVRNQQDSLITVAQLTGGRAVVNTNDFESAIKVIDNEMSDYYILGYTTSNPDPLKKVRHIEVQVKRPGAVVSLNRKTYSLTPLPVIKR